MVHTCKLLNMRDITNMRFGRLIALSIAGKERDRHLRWNCICDCGNNTIVSSTNSIQGNITSCGCYKKEVTGNLNKTHNKTKTREYRIWCGSSRYERYSKDKSLR